MIYGFMIDPSLCNECGECMSVCASVKTGGDCVLGSRIEIIPHTKTLPEIGVCRFEDCEGMPCIDACSFGAITNLGGYVYIDSVSCTGCGACETACPYKAIRIERGIAWKCDFCAGNPECVGVCGTGAIKLPQK